MPGALATQPITLHTVTMVYTHVLNCGPAGVRTLRQCKEDIMPNRISCYDKLLHRVQLLEYTGINTPLASDSKASYTGRKTQLRILCGLV
jgi:hypothetical protein